MSKVLLLNPPHERLMMRDSYCSESSKGSYYWAPIDLIVQSGIIASRHEVVVLDANIERLGVEESLQAIGRIRPEAILTLFSAAALPGDIAFLSKVKRHWDVPLIGSGDILLFEKEYAMANFDFLDAILLDYSSAEILKYLEGERENLQDMCWRTGGQVWFGPRTNKRKMHFPIPRHELFPLGKYHLPFSRNVRAKTTSVISNFGCPYTCTFCQFGNIDYQVREISEFMQELAWLVELGVSDVFIRDLTFGPSIKRGKEICRQIMDRKICLSWTCEARVDTVDHELLGLMKASGCFCVMFGVESGSDLILDQENKRITLERTKDVFGYCEKIGLPTLGHFILGLPNDDHQTIGATIDFARELPTTYASFNLFVPRLGTTDRRKMVEQGFLGAHDFSDLDCSRSVRSFSRLSEDEVRGYFRKALASFYFRPSQMWRVMRRTSLGTVWTNGLAVARSML